MKGFCESFMSVSLSISESHEDTSSIVRCCGCLPIATLVLSHETLHTSVLGM